MICPKCKKEIKDNARFCGYCGNKFEVSNKTASKEKAIIKKEKQIVKENSSDERNYPMFERIKKDTDKTMEAIDKMYSNKKKKKASVIGRGVAGGIIAGAAGAVVGALSAVDKNVIRCCKKRFWSINSRYLSMGKIIQ